MLERITELKSELNFIDNHKSILEKEKIEVKELEKEKNSKQEILKKEKIDVELLEKLSFRYIFHSILGNKQEQLNYEIQEAIQANIEYQRALNDYEYKLEYISKLEKRINNEENIIQELKELQSKVHINNKEIQEFSNRIVDIQAKQKELKEALETGTIALNSLLKVQKSLKSANNWATADILDVDFSGIIKRDYIRTAQKQSQEADMNVQRFERELKDVFIEKVDIINIEDFSLTFDILFDNIFTDFSTKNRIKSSLLSIQSTIASVETIINQLKQRQTELNQQLSKNKEALKEILQIL